MNRAELDANVAKTAMKGLNILSRNSEMTDEYIDTIYEGFQEVAGHLFTITDDEITIIREAVNMIKKSDPIFVHHDNKDKFECAIEMINDILDLIEKAN